MRQGSFSRLGPTAIVVISLAGCGSRLPPLEDFPKNDASTQQFIHDVIHSIHCEVFTAVRQVDPAGFLSGWGAQVLLTLQVDETSGFGPNALLSIPIPAPTFFTLGFGASLTHHATRIEKVNFFYSVDQLRSLSESAKCTQPKGSSSLLIQSDLGLYDWLEGEAISVDTNEFGVPDNASGIFKQNVLSHEIKFDVLASGNLTPGSKGSRITINQTGSLASTSREKLHDLLITLGPIDKTAVAGLIPAAENAHLASQINMRPSIFP